MLTNYLAAEDLIVAQLQALVPEFKAVLSAADLADVAEAAQVTPAAYVLYDGDEITTTAGDGMAQRVLQRWLVVVTDKNMRDTKTTKTARQQAGALVTKTLQALMGWQPSAEHGPLTRVAGFPPGFAAGYAYIPLVFTTEVIAEGAGNG